MNRHLVGSIYVRPSLKNAHFVPQAILVSDWSIKEKSSPLNPPSQMNRNLVESIYGRSSVKTAQFVQIRK
jgi:hypothetical protein